MKLDLQLHASKVMHTITRKIEKQALQDYQMTALTTYKLFAADKAATQERIAQRPNIAREGGIL